MSILLQIQSAQASAVTTMMIIEWVAMGCLFLVIILTVILSTDMDGVPDDLLFKHLHANQLMYTVPQPFAYAGLFLLAVGYGIDIDERIGCPTFSFDTITAPCFPVWTFIELKYAQGRRRRSGEMFSEKNDKKLLGVALLVSCGGLLVEEKGRGDEEHRR